MKFKVILDQDILIDLEQQDGDIERDVSSLQTKVFSLEESVTALGEQVSLLSGRVSVLEESVVDPEPPVDPDPLPEATHHIYPGDNIEATLRNLVAGDVMEIHAGTYNEEIEVRNLHGTPEQPIIVRSAIGETPLIKSAGWVVFDTSECSYITYDGLNVSEADYDGFYVTNAHHIVIKNCASHHNGGIGIHVLNQRGNADYNIVRFNEVTYNGAEGIYVDCKAAAPAGATSDHNIVEDNIINFNKYDGVQNTNQYGVAPFPNHTIIRRNVIGDNSLNSHSWATMDLAGDDLLVEENIIHNVAAQSGCIWGKLTNSIIRKNKATNDYFSYTYGDAICLDGCSNVVVEDNETFGIGKSGFGITVRNSSGVTLSGNVHA